MRIGERTVVEWILHSEVHEIRCPSPNWMPRHTSMAWYCWSWAVEDNKVTQVSCMPRTNLLRFYLTLPWLQLRARFCHLCPGSEEWSCYILDKVGCPRNCSGCPSFLSEKKSCRILTGSSAAAYLYIPGHLKIYFNHLGYFDMPRHNQCITCSNKKQQCIENCLSCPVPPTSTDSLIHPEHYSIVCFTCIRKLQQAIDSVLRALVGSSC